MAIDKAIDSVKLESDLSSIADAIREKGGTSDELAFPAGFVSAIGSISAGGNGGAKIATGKVEQTIETREIIHNLGVVPDLFMYYITCENMTGRDMATSATFAGETAYKSSDWSHYPFKVKPMLIWTRNYVISYTLGGNIDWGFLTYAEGNEVVGSTSELTCDETKFALYDTGSCGIPHSESGNITIHWLAVAETV